MATEAILQLDKSVTFHHSLENLASCLRVFRNKARCKYCTDILQVSACLGMGEASCCLGPSRFINTQQSLMSPGPPAGLAPVT